MKELTIGEVARRAGVQTSAIRYYESVGLLPPPKRMNGRRRYESSVLQRLGIIQLAREADFGIRELQVLLGVGSDDDTSKAVDWHTLAAEKTAEMDARIQRAQAIKSWLTEIQRHDCSGMDDCAVQGFDDSGTVSVSYRDEKEITS